MSTDSAFQLSPLESLPPELLAIIFDDQYPILRRPPSTTLRPFVQRNQYRNIPPIRYDSFIKLCATVKASPNLAELIQCLIIVPNPADQAGSYRVKHEELIFYFFKSLTALKRIELHDARLQSRLLSDKYITHCYGALQRLSIVSAHDPDVALQQSRHFSRFAKLHEVSVFVGEQESKPFTSMQKRRFEEEDRLALAGTAENTQVENSVKSLSIFGRHTPFVLLHDFVARFSRLEEFSLVVYDIFISLPVLRSVNPSSLLHLLIIEDFESTGRMLGYEDIKHFDRLSLLTLSSKAFSLAFVTSLSTFRNLTRIRVHDLDAPIPSIIRILLKPATRPPALKSLEFRLPVWIPIEGTRYGVSHHDVVEHGALLPQWGDGWSIDSARELFELAKGERIELLDSEEWEKAIRMTDEYWAAQGGR